MLDHFLHGVPPAPRELPPAADRAPAARRLEHATLASDPPPVDLVR
jgi:hypothetical protein